MVTGAAGYLGRIIARRLAANHELTLVDRRPGEARELPVDITDLATVRQVARGQDAVIHCVALVRGMEHLPLGAFVHTIVLGTWTVAEACALEGVSTLINISSVAADGFPASGENQRKVGDPVCFSPTDRFYAISKHLGEAVANAYGVAFGLRVLNLRPGVLAGDGLNQGPERPGNADRFWFAYVDPFDVADGVARALESTAAGTYQLVAARSDSLWDWEPASRDFGYAPRNNWERL
jgi:nucleoside-diphosphate-sugar epimerase